MSTILIVDDDKNLRFSFKTWMKKEGYEILEAPDGPTAIEVVDRDHVDLVVMDIRMPGMTGLEAFEIIHQRHPKLPVIIATAYGTTDTAIKTMHLGAYDYVLKPMELQELKRIIASAIEDSRLARNAVQLPGGPEEEDYDGTRIVGSSPAMQSVYKLIGKVSRDNSNVLITGPSGSGKELVARAIFNYSHRADNLFQAVNCAALPEHLLESELFGHEKGAFTGAHKTKLGRFERCHGGTLFLDEIGDMPLLMQAKVLRIIQEQSFERVGGTKTINVDVRLIAATNRDLRKMVQQGDFREDLYYRLQVVHIPIPPLDKRKSDIPEMVDYFLRKFNKSKETAIEGVTEEALTFLVNRNWPGNVRELQNSIQRAMVLCPTQVLREEDFSFLSSPADKGAEAAARKLKELTSQLIHLARDNQWEGFLGELEGRLIEAAMEETGGNQVQAAKLLGMNRNTLYSRLKKMGLV